MPGGEGCGARGRPSGVSRAGGERDFPRAGPVAPPGGRRQRQAWGVRKRALLGRFRLLAAAGSRGVCGVRGRSDAGRAPVRGEPTRPGLRPPFQPHSAELTEPNKLRTGLAGGGTHVRGRQVVPGAEGAGASPCPTRVSAQEAARTRAGSGRTRRGRRVTRWALHDCSGGGWRRGGRGRSWEAPGSRRGEAAEPGLEQEEVVREPNGQDLGRRVTGDVPARQRAPGDH